MFMTESQILCFEVCVSLLLSCLLPSVSIFLLSLSLSALCLVLCCALTFRAKKIATSHCILFHCAALMWSSVMIEILHSPAHCRSNSVFTFILQYVLAAAAESLFSITVADIIIIITTPVNHSLCTQDERQMFLDARDKARAISEREVSLVKQRVEETRSLYCNAFQKENPDDVQLLRRLWDARYVCLLSLSLSPSLPPLATCCLLVCIKY
jgi:hypothetical protein